MAIISYCESPVGTLTLAEENGALARLEFGKTPPAPADSLAHTPLLKAAAAQMEEYFAGRRRAFSLPLAPLGTPFQMRVWQALQTIPYGCTISYKELAQKADSPRGFRAVGMANNRNPIAIIIPCHRVVGADGSLTGYGGGLNVKQRLLELEGAR